MRWNPSRALAVLGMLVAVCSVEPEYLVLWQPLSADAATPAPFDELRERFRTSDTLYASVDVSAGRQIGGEWVVRASLGSGSAPPRVVAFGRIVGDQAYWDGATLSHSNQDAPIPTSKAEIEALLAAVFEEARAGFPTTSVVEATPVEAGIEARLDDRRPWVRLGFAHPDLRDLDVYLSMTTVPWVAPYELIIARGTIVVARVRTSVVEWNVTIDPTVFTAERPLRSPPLIPGSCTSPLASGCQEIPPELVDRVTPTGELVSQLHPSRLAYHGVSPDGRGVVCHRPPGFPDHAFTILVDLRDVKDHFAHGDAVGTCRGEHVEDAREDPDDPEGKTTLCHIPPGDPASAHTLQVADVAVAAHLGHGDYLGACYPPESADGDAGDGTEPGGGQGDAAPGGSAPGDASSPNSGGSGCLGCDTGRPAGGAPLLLAAALLVQRRRRRGA